MTFPDLGCRGEGQDPQRQFQPSAVVGFVFEFFDCAGSSLCSTRPVHGSTLGFFHCSAGSVVVTHLTGALPRLGIQTHVPCIGGQIINHWTTRGVPSCPFFKFSFCKT